MLKEEIKQDRNTLQVRAKKKKPKTVQSLVQNVQINPNHPAGNESRDYCIHFLNLLGLQIL